MTDTGDRGWEAGVAKAQVSVSPVLVEVAQRRVAEAKAAGREPSAATVLIANARVQSVREPVAITDGAATRVTRPRSALTGSPARTRKHR